MKNFNVTFYDKTYDKNQKRDIIEDVNCMKIYRLDVPLTTKNALNGIIYTLNNTYKINPLKQKYVVPSSFGTAHGHLTSLVDWQDEYVAGQGSEENPPWVQLTFPRGVIFPTAYSMRGVSSQYSFAKSWYVYGISKGDEFNKNNWRLLGENDTSQSTFCNILLGDGCADTRTGTFELRTTFSNEGFRHLRFVAKEHSPSDRYFFSTSGIDIYGKYIFSETIHRGTLCVKNKYRPNQLQFAILLSIIQ